MWWQTAITGREHAPLYILDRVTNAYSQLERRPEEPIVENPVKKVGFIPSGQEGQVFLYEVIQEYKEQNGQEWSNTTSNITDRPVIDQLRGVHSQVSALRNTIERLEQKVESQQVTMNKYFQSINLNIRKIRWSPARPGCASGYSHTRHCAEVSYTREWTKDIVWFVERMQSRHAWTESSKRFQSIWRLQWTKTVPYLRNEAKILWKVKMVTSINFILYWKLTSKNMLQIYKKCRWILKFIHTTTAFLCSQARHWCCFWQLELSNQLSVE